MFKTVGIITQKSSHKPADQVYEVYELLKSHKIKNILLDEKGARAIGVIDFYSRKDLLKKVDLLIVLGGDGTLINLAKHIKISSPPVLTINTGTVGFLTEIEKENISVELPQIFSKETKIDSRSLIKVRHNRNGRLINEYQALNDAVITHGSKSRLIDLCVNIDDVKVNNYQSDGLIVATTTGSTAHALSAGGPIIHPHIEAFVIAPICPISLATRPIVIPSDKVVSIRIDTFRERNESLMLTIDGQVCVPVEYKDEIVITKSKPKLNLLRLNKESYYDQLKQKLRWG